MTNLPPELTRPGVDLNLSVTNLCHVDTRPLLGEYKRLILEANFAPHNRHVLADVRDYDPAVLWLKKKMLLRILEFFKLPISPDNIIFVSVSQPSTIGRMSIRQFQTELPKNVDIRFSTSLKSWVDDRFVKRYFRDAGLSISEVDEHYLPERLREQGLAARVLSLPIFIGCLMIAGHPNCQALIQLARSFFQGFRFYGTYRNDPRNYIVLVA